MAPIARRHARQPVEFAKSVRTLADLNCKVLLEIGPHPVLTAAALRAWPDPATAPRAIASPAPKHRRPPTDHRSRRRRVRLGPRARLRCIPAGARAKARPTHLSVRASSVLVRENRERPEPATAPWRTAYRGRRSPRTAGSKNSRLY